MEEYMEAGMLVIQLTAMASLWAVIAVAYACTKGFITDTIPTMPWHLSGILTMREYGYGGSNLRGVVDPISWFALFQTVLIAIGISMLSILVWPLYILLAVMYTLRAAYRARESIMEFFRAIMNYRPERPGDSFIDKAAEIEKLGDMWDAVQKTQDVCTCKGAPHDDDCAVLKDWPVTVVGENSVEEPRWARAPESERKQDGS